MLGQSDEAYRAYLLQLAIVKADLQGQTLDTAALQFCRNGYQAAHL